MPQICPAKQASGVKQYGRIDLVICLDTTDSMSPIIDSVRDHVINHLINEIKNQVAHNQIPLDWRARVIGYGDLDSDPFCTSPFTTDEQSLIDAIQTVYRSGGSTEYTLDALMTAAGSPWRTDVAAHRIVILFTDEPTAPQLHPYTGSGGVDTVISELTDKKIKLFLFGPEDPIYLKLKRLPKSDITLFPAAAIHEMLVKLDFSKIFEQMAKTISNEIINNPAAMQ